MTDRQQEHVEHFSSNAVRLSMREWLGVAVVLLLLVGFAGPVWKKLETFEPSADYRIPYSLSEDYWLFDRFCRDAGDSDKSFVIGDSFVWGQYVKKEETLSHFLNQQAGFERFVNAGLDGTHPLALEGLVEHHCGGLRNREVVLHLNLLWLSTPQADLQLERASQFNHPRLVPQFFPAIPAYNASVSDRLGVVTARYLPTLDWARHIRSAYFANADLSHWTLDNPYLNPLRQITLALPESEDDPHPNARPWFVDGATLRALPWVDVEASLQWQAFRRLVVSLQARGNQLFVLVGPLNEHMLEPSNLAAYEGILTRVESWLTERGLPYYVPPVLPRDLYADMSHPLAQGYELLARDLWEQMSIASPGAAPHSSTGGDRAR